MECGRRLALQVTSLLPDLADPATIVAGPTLLNATVVGTTIVINVENGDTANLAFFSPRTAKHSQPHGIRGCNVTSHAM